MDKQSLRKIIDESEVMICTSYSDLLDSPAENGYKAYAEGNTYHLLVLKKRNGDYSRRLIYNAIKTLRKDFMRYIRKAR